MKKHILLIILLLFVFNINNHEVYGQEKRFPHPEFQTDYKVPQHDYQSQISNIPDYVRVAALILLLIIGFVAVYKLRSRKLLIFVIMTNLLTFGFLFHGCICPIGLIQNISAAVFNSTVPVTIWYALIFLIPLAAAVFAGRLFCSCGCPLGALQELTHIKTVQVPFVLDKILRFLPYFIIGSAIALAGAGMGYYICRYDPYVSIFRLGALQNITVLTVIFLVLGTFISRPYCRYICPYGVLLKLLSYLSNKKVAITENECIDCRLCEKSCPNNAIVPAAPLTQPEKYEKGRNRIKYLIYSIPIMLTIAGITGYIFGDYISYYHPDKALHRNLKVENKKDKLNKLENFEIEAFLSSGKPVDKLVKNYEKADKIFKWGFSASFMLAFLLCIIDIIILSRARTNKHPYVDISNCYACARCYSYCPVNKEAAKPQIKPAGKKIETNTK